MPMIEPSKMTKGERQELGQLIRKREKVMKAMAIERSAVLLADYDAQSAKIYHYDDDEVWKGLHDEATAAVARARAGIEDRCAELGIPREFAPDMSVAWFGRGENALRDRRVELRRAAKSRIEAIEAEAVARIERESLRAQTEVLAHGLESEAARIFINDLPKLEQLMPPVNATDIERLVDEKRAKSRTQRYLQ